MSSAEIRVFVEGISRSNKLSSESTPLTAEDRDGHEMSGGPEKQLALEMVEEKPYDKKYEIPEKGFTLGG